jgi:hypothetical protein
VLMIEIAITTNAVGSRDDLAQLLPAGALCE